MMRNPPVAWQRWREAEKEASNAERLLFRRYLAYFGGEGACPTAHDLQGVKRLREIARRRFDEALHGRSRDTQISLD